MFEARFIACAKFHFAVLPYLFECLLYRALAWMFTETTRNVVASVSAVAHPSIPRSAASWFLVGFVACLSSPVVRNMASQKQTMNRTFEPFRIVNTYGAFGSVSKFRPEIVIKAALALEGENTAWREYEVRVPATWMMTLRTVLWHLFVTAEGLGVRPSNYRRADSILGSQYRGVYNRVRPAQPPCAYIKVIAINIYLTTVVPAV